MQVKTTRYCFISIRMAVIKNKKQQQKISVGKDLEKLELLPPAGGNVKWYSQGGKEHKN